MRTTESFSTQSSAGWNSRPTSGGTPSTSKNPDDTHCRGTVSAEPSTPRITMPPTPLVNPAVAVIDGLPASQSLRLSGDTPLREPLCVRSVSTTTWSGSRNGSGRSNVASTSAKIALLAPMPSASVSAATKVKPGAARICRRANTTSYQPRRSIA